MNQSSLLIDEEILTVSELNNKIAETLNENLNKIHVQGEISNLAMPRSGHVYFSIKDEKSQIRCVMFKMQAQRLNFKLEDGLKIIVIANTSLYKERGDLQLIASIILPQGGGQLQLAFNQLKSKLSQKGYFQQEIKKDIPVMPMHIGIISSATGAALKDILRILKRRWPIAKVYLYPCQVQGQQAKVEISEQIALANKHALCQVLILARGGGSIEDLWAFNEEMVASAIYLSDIPIVTGIGHEIDYTIADFCADIRAATPSEAAEHTTPLLIDVYNKIRNIKNKMLKLINTTLQFKEQRLDLANAKLVSPEKKLQLNFNRILTQTNKLTKAIQHLIELKNLKLKYLDNKIKDISPNKVLTRGFSITSNQDGKTIINCNTVKLKDKIKVKLTDGTLNCEVTDIIKDKS